MEDNNWLPLPRVGRGVSIGEYNPPNFVPNMDVRLSLGDYVYIFEKHSSGLWCRGFVVSLPKAHSAYNQPSAPTANNAPLRPLELTVATGIMPSYLVRIREYTNFTSTQGELNTNNSRCDGGESKPPVPAVPYLRLAYDSLMVPGEDLVDDIVSVIKEWFTVYTYHYFLEGKYELVERITNTIAKLDLIKKKLSFGLLTEIEKVTARRTVIWHITRMTKLLNRGIIVRYPNTGDYIPQEDGRRLAQEQMLLALAANYPQYTLTSNSGHRSKLPRHVMVDFISVNGQRYKNNLTAICYLRSTSMRLTESVEVKIKPTTVVAELSAILFSDLPVSVTQSDIYLAVELYEDLNIDTVSKSGKQKSVNGRHGVACGATSISRLFQVEGNSETPFTIRMFTSYFEQNCPSQQNKGWGELMTRVINGSPTGV
jgi:dedicator of cytokinesis protein 3